MMHLRLPQGPFRMAVEQPIPPGMLPKVRWTLTYATSWMIPLVAIERFADEHYRTGWVLTGLFVTNLIVVSIWDKVAELGSTRRRHLAFAFIAVGAVILGIGIYLLAVQPRQQENASAAPVAVVPSVDPDRQSAETTKQLMAERRQREALDRQLATTRSELQRAQQQVNEAQQEAAKAKRELVPPANEGGPINWTTNGQFVVVSGGGPDALIHSVLIQGTSTASVAITKAYAVSGLTGHQQDLMANVPYRGYYPVDKVDIPSLAPVWLELIWKPPLSIKDFLDQWGKFRITVVYNDFTYSREFDETYIHKKLQQEIPGAFGPRVTPKNEK